MKNRSVSYPEGRNKVSGGNGSRKSVSSIFDMRSTKVSLLGTRIGDYTIRFLPGIEADHAPGYTTVDFR